MTPANKRIRAAMITLTAIFLLLVGAVFKITSDDINSQRTAFCAFAGQVVAGARQLPQVPGRVDAERAYAQLETKLRCH